jgi:hypothetical protein
LHGGLLSLGHALLLLQLAPRDHMLVVKLGEEPPSS